MRRQRALERQAPTAQQADRGVDVLDQPLDLAGSPYLTVAEAARFLRFDATAPANPEHAFRLWLKRQAVPVVYRGRTMLVERRVLVAMLAS